MNRSRIALAAAALVLAAGAVQAERVVRPSVEARLELANRYAGEPVESVRFRIPVPIYDWEPIGNEALIVWQTRSHAWLVDLERSDSCNRLEHALNIAIDSPVDSLSTRSGYVDFAGGYCKMERIRPLDVAGWREAERSLRTVRRG
jgi:hypothetical protein